MKVYFLRHGEADWPEWNKPDDERPLTKSGRKEMKRVAKFLRKLDPEISVILSSPLPRARQTAEIVATCLEIDLEEEPSLRKGFNAATLRKLSGRRKSGSIMLVGHEPDFSRTIRELTGAKLKLAKAGLALVDCPNATSCQLLWLISPRIAKL